MRAASAFAAVRAHPGSSGEPWRAALLGSSSPQSSRPSALMVTQRSRVNLRGLVPWSLLVIGTCAVMVSVALAVTGSAQTLPVFIGGSVAGLIGLFEVLSQRFDHRPFRDQPADPRVARFLIRLLVLTSGGSVQLVFDQGRSAWYLLLPMLPLGAWLFVRTMPQQRPPS
jgi:hypothetical protein